VKYDPFIDTNGLNKSQLQFKAYTYIYYDEFQNSKAINCDFLI